VDLDLDLASEQSSENDVYYVQYAHARIASMLAKVGAERVRAASAEVSAATELEREKAGAERVPAASAAATELEREPLHATERALVEQLLAFPAELAEAAERRAPHRIAAYVLALAQTFTAFYRDCHVVGAEPEAVESFRIVLCVASRRTIARCLGVLGVSAPERM
jgi:arginyl-tRNA synthetase